MAAADLVLRLRAAGARGAARDVDSVGKAVDRTKRKTQQASTRMGRFDSVLKGTNKRLSGISRGLKGAGSSLSALTYPIIGAAAGAGYLAINFDKAMRNVNSIAQLPERQLQKLQRDVLALAGPTAQAPQTLAEGLYDLVSSGFNARESLRIVKAAAYAATAGLTDAATSTKVMAAVLNAYRLPASQAKNVSDQLFQTVKVGVITFEELAQNIGDTLPFAASLGVSLTEVGAATATMTKQGLGAPETMTRIRNLMQTMIKPGEGLKEAFKELGVESGESLIKQKGFQGALDALIGTTDGSKKAVAKLFPNIRALGGALALTGKNSRSAGKDLKAMQKSSGQTSKALSQQSKSASYQWNRFMANVKVLGIELATAFLPTMKDVVDFLSRLVKAFRGLEPGQKKFIVFTLLAIGVLGPLLILFGAIAAAGAALATTAGAVVLGIAALAAGVAYAYTRWQWFRDGVAIAWEILKRMPLVLILRNIGKIIDAFKSIPGAIKSGWISAVNFMIDRINNVIDVINFAINAFNKLPGPQNDIGLIDPLSHIGPHPTDANKPNYGGFNPLMGKPLTPTGPQPFGGNRSRPQASSRQPRQPATASSTRAGDTIIPITLEMDGEVITKKVHRHSVKKKSVS